MEQHPSTDTAAAFCEVAPVDLGMLYFHVVIAESNMRLPWRQHCLDGSWLIKTNPGTWVFRRNAKLSVVEDLVSVEMDKAIHLERQCLNVPPSEWECYNSTWPIHYVWKNS
jgi:hypothetical protein